MGLAAAGAIVRLGRAIFVWTSIGELVGLNRVDFVGTRVLFSCFLLVVPPIQ